jgi:hypothetical protein
MSAAFSGVKSAAAAAAAVSGERNVPTRNVGGDGAATAPTNGVNAAASSAASVAVATENAITVAAQARVDDSTTAARKTATTRNAFAL